MKAPLSGTSPSPDADLKAGAASYRGRELLVRAPAKINLNLHIEQRRPDGYHDLSGLVVFADIADELHFKPTPFSPRTNIATGWSLDVSGPFADPLRDASGRAGGNLVIEAVRLFGEQVERRFDGAICLQKNLPVASGIGGGSADAAATLNALQQIHAFPLEDRQLRRLAQKLGADVPMCLAPTAQLIAGIGDVCQEVTNFSPLSAVLVNPLVDVKTPLVFKELCAADIPRTADQQIERLDHLRTFVDQQDTIDWLRAQRNDLQAPAIRLAPLIADVLGVLDRDTSCGLARMSGSGATCFGLYNSTEEACNAAQKISSDHPDWWVVATLLR